MRLAAYGFRESQLLDNEEIADILSKADELVSGCRASMDTLCRR